ncbi:glycosyltransferase family 2 protein [Ottowia thiooxydans]|uniref:glycosyltransferase family 2 protein n=1 Tax=Ottowia thiooxydans TaxID=219182 RepID=UPI00048CA6D4|nr:glycosyltransferase family 2 protein [Ottowia thiooxydans]
MSDRHQSTPSISCVMPAYNEAGGLAAVAERVLAALKALSPQVEIIIVNDGSRDDTSAIARRLCAEHPQLRLLDLSRNFGKEAALTAGLEAASGDVVILMDADGQHPVSLFPDMLEKWRQGSDVVYAVRRSREDQSGIHKRLANLFYSLVNFGNQVKIPAGAGDFRLLDRQVVRALNSLPERHRFMKGLYAWVGFPSIAIDYLPLEREGGQSNFRLRGALRLGVTGLLAFSSAPLRAVGFLGLLLSMLSLGYGAWVVIEYFWLGISVPGYATLVVGMMLLSGVQLTAIGLLAEYVARIYDEVKQRPNYLVAARIGQGLSGEKAQTDK